MDHLLILKKKKNKLGILILLLLKVSIQQPTEVGSEE